MNEDEIGVAFGKLKNAVLTDNEADGIEASRITAGTLLEGRPYQ